MGNRKNSRARGAGITEEIARKYLDYYPAAGTFRWVVTNRKAKRGNLAGCRRNHGYIDIGIETTVVYAHRLAFLFMTGAWPQDGLEVDHINRDTSDNRWSNLRLATRQQNAANRVTSIGRPMGVRPEGLKWRACIKIQGRTKTLGTFETMQEAADAYRASAIAANGSFAPALRAS